MTVFTIPPRYVSLERCKQSVGRGEGVLRLDVSEVTMVSLANLVVVSNDAESIDDIRQAVLELVRGPCNCRRHLPEDQLGEGVLSVDNSSSGDEGRFHVGDNDNTAGCCQLQQHVVAVAMATSHHDRRFDANYATRFDSEVPMRAAVA
ncbi:MAG: hypothetical protein IPH50_07240 [Rhodanobacteraceae bacterium]|nr:hypothetical protein [Rhodanobacteraceae bacterium]MBP9153850.1 hypothetical protein [Xanthomonadales bacterium]